MPFVDPAFPVLSLREGLEANGWRVEVLPAKWPTHTLWNLSSQWPPEGVQLFVRFDGDIGDTAEQPSLIGSVSVGRGLFVAGARAETLPFRISRWPDVLSQVLEYCDQLRRSAVPNGP